MTTDERAPRLPNIEGYAHTELAVRLATERDKALAENARLRQRVEKAEAERDVLAELRMNVVMALCTEDDDEERTDEQVVAAIRQFVRDRTALVDEMAKRGFPPLWEPVGDTLAAVDTLRQGRDEARAERDAIAATLEQLRREVGKIRDEAHEDWQALKGGPTAIAVTHSWYRDRLTYALDPAHKAPTEPPEPRTATNAPKSQEGSDTPQVVQDDPGARERVSGDAMAVARLFHETYERLAPDFGYRTREASAKPWDEVPEQNRALMVATVREVLAAIAAPRDPKAEGSPAGQCGDSIPGLLGPALYSCHLAHGHTGAHSDGTATWTNREAGS
jgi:hypothetical protein